MDTNFAETGDICITNPKNCEKGLSVSVFYRAELDVDPGELSNNLHKYKDKRETLLSTGGDYGYPGFQIYREGPVFGGILSTGEETWEVRIKLSKFSTGNKKYFTIATGEGDGKPS